MKLTSREVSAKLSTLFGGSDQDYGMTIACDSGIAYVVGQTYSTSFNSTSSSGPIRIFVSILDITTGNLFRLTANL